MPQSTYQTGTKLFLFGVCRLIKNGVAESCSCIENQMQEGLASYLYKKYATVFDDLDFNLDFLVQIDEYFRNQVCFADGNEYRKYDCTENEGLWLVLELAIDNAF